MTDIDNSKKDTVDGFDFDGMDWGNDDADTSASSSSKPSSDKDDGFGGSSDDGFGDDSFGGDSFFSLEQMPDMDKQDAFTDLGDDFGDIKTDEPIPYDFGSDADDLPSGHKITDYSDDEPADPFGGAYAAADTNADEEEEAFDPFNMQGGREPDDVEEIVNSDQEPVAEKTKSKFMTYAMSAAAAVIAVAGIVYVAPSFMGSAPQQVAEVQPVQEEAPPFPSTLPPQAPTPPVAAAPVQDTVAAPAPPALEPVATPAPVPSAEPVLSLPEVPSTPVAAPTEEPPVLVEAPIAIDPLDGLVGGKERGGIDALKDTAAVATPVVTPTPVKQADPASAPEISALERRLAALEGKVDRLSDSFDNYVETSLKVAPSASLPAAAPVSAPQALGDIVPPLKPQIIEGVVLKGVAGEVAWLSGKAGVFEVKVGDPVPNGGNVVSFRQYRGDWVVVTTDGIIVRQ